MNKREIRGVQSFNEIDAKTRYVDVRTKTEKFKEDISEPKLFLMWVYIPLIIAFFFPVLLEFGIFLALLIMWWGASLQNKVSLPFKIPKSAGIIDQNETNPANGKPQMGDGIGYFGVEASTSKELWFTNGDLRTHILMMGSTGAGKTEALLSLSFNAITWGSGFVYVDGKGTAELYTKIFGMARSMGREDDVLVINYMKGNKDFFGPQETKLSNTMNPFTSGSAGSLTELIVSLMDDGGSGGGSDMWKGRAMALIAAIMQALTYLRDQNEILLDVEVIRDYLVLDKIVALGKRRDLPTHVLKALKGYLLSIPGYVEGAQKIDQQATEQHGYLQMQFTKVLSTLADAYAHIFKTNFGEVNFWDVVVNRRILVVLLPSLEFSEPELANLGKIIIACLRAMMATGLGNSLEGSIQEVVEVNPTKGNTPFITILDEYGYYAVKGSAVMAAQARGLGFCMCFAGQDYPSFKKASAEEAAAISANCNIKICLKLEDPQETFDLFKAAAGQSYVTVKSGYDQEEGGALNAGGKYRTMKNVNIDMKDRIDLRDLQSQMAGESHIFFGGQIVRAKFFYADPPKVGEIRVNYFLKVETPEKQDLLDMQTGVKELVEKLTDSTFQNDIELANNQSVELAQLRTWFDQDKNSSLEERAISVLVEFNTSNKMQTFALTAMLDSPPSENSEEIDVFAKNSDEDEGGMPDEYSSFLDEEVVRKQIVDIEQFGGDDKTIAEQKSYDLVKDMKVATNYGVNDAPEDLNFDGLVAIISDIEEILDEGDD